MGDLPIFWNRPTLRDLAAQKLHDYKLIVVSNREPYMHRYCGDRIECIQPASGMATALDPVMGACGGVWVAHGSGDADREVADSKGRTSVPPDSPAYTLRRVWLNKRQEDEYYYGLSNEGLWPLCHVAFTRPTFNPRDWQTYREVNELFAEAVLEEAGDVPTFVFIQDYHFALLPRILKSRNPNLVVGQFWHIPWPNPETFRVCPWAEDIVKGLLGNDLLGFHLRYHCHNFLETVDRTLEARVDHEHYEVTRGGKVTRVRPLPISIDYERHVETAATPEVERQMTSWRKRLGLRDEFIGLGIDRMDYTKGIPERLRAIDHFLEKNPAHRGKFVFVQIGVPSRSRISEYKRTEDEIDRLVEDINWKWETGSRRPIILLKDHQGPVQMMALHRLADFCLVSSLHDGMNLVAKEYVSSRFDEEGMLILSRFTGAARELSDSLLVNPFDVDECAEAIRTALEMPNDERHRRMRRMREVVAENNIFGWAAKVISQLIKLEVPHSSAHEAVVHGSMEFAREEAAAFH